jgi:hypothetical protein
MQTLGYIYIHIVQVLSQCNILKVAVWIPPNNNICNVYNIYTYYCIVDSMFLDLAVFDAPPFLTLELNAITLWKH